VDKTRKIVSNLRRRRRRRRDELWENHVFVLWSKLGLHQGQMHLSHGPWVLPWILHPKSRVPWGSINHGPMILVQPTP
jgi:hypothetical protein